MIQSFLKKCRKKKIRVAVLGDVMLDEYYGVEVSRISPEAPVPVLKTESSEPSEVRPGGAANVAFQLHHWNVDCDLYGFMDDDAASILEFNGIRTYPVNRDPFKRVPRKRRYYQTQSLFRWDVEDNVSYNGIELDALLKEFAQRHYDVVILSDYDKGTFHPDFCREVINLCKARGSIVIVDPKNQPIEKWEGCTVFKPNSIEAARFVDTKMPSTRAEILAKKLKSKVVITDGGKGVTGYDESNFEWASESEVPVNAAIYGYSGAGDCFCAFLGVALGHGFSLQEASQIAWHAGALYVKTGHNQPILPLEMYPDKFAEPLDLADRHFKLVVTNGCFDVLHYGHLKTLEFAKSKGDKLVVAINSDESVKRLKGSERPINTLEHRMQMLAALECVDYVVSFEEDSPYNVISKMKPQVLVKGGDYKIDQIRSADLVDEVYVAPLVDGLSTTKIMKRIK